MHNIACELIVMSCHITNIYNVSACRFSTKTSIVDDMIRILLDQDYSKLLAMEMVYYDWILTILTIYIPSNNVKPIRYFNHVLQLIR